MIHLPDPATSMEVTCPQVAEWQALPPSERPRLIDCREREEWDICHLPGAELLPLSSFPLHADTLGDTRSGVVVYCHHGMRSLRAAAFLREAGIPNAFSMAGGIDAWSQSIDAGVPRY